MHVVIDGKSLDRFWRENVDKLFANLDENDVEELTGDEMATAHNRIRLQSRRSQ